MATCKYIIPFITVKVFEVDLLMSKAFSISNICTVDAGSHPFRGSARHLLHQWRVLQLRQLSTGPAGRVPIELAGQASNVRLHPGCQSLPSLVEEHERQLQRWVPMAEGIGQDYTEATQTNSWNLSHHQ